MDAKRMRFFRDFSIQNKMLLIILPLIVVPMLILATVGFITASREAAKTSTRYLKQRENDLLVGTFGRGFYVLDDYSPLRDLDEAALEQEAILFPVKQACQPGTWAHLRRPLFCWIATTACGTNTWSMPSRFLASFGEDVLERCEAFDLMA